MAMCLWVGPSDRGVRVRVGLERRRLRSSLGSPTCRVREEVGSENQETTVSLKVSQDRKQVLC